MKSLLSKLQNTIRSSSRYENMVLATLSIAHFLDDGLGRGFAVLLPTIRSHFGLSYVDVGLIGSIQSGTQAIGTPAIGWVSDKIAKRKLFLILGIAGFTFGIATIGFAPSYPIMLLLTCIGYLAACVYHPQATSILNFSFRKRLHSAIGIHGAVGALGIIVCPILLSLASASFEWKIAPLLVYTPMLVLTIVLIVVILQDVSASERRPFHAGVLRKSWISIAMLAAYSGMTTFAYMNLGLFMPLYLQTKGLSIVEIGSWLGMGGIGNVIGQFIAGFGTERVGTRRTVILTSILYGVFFFTFLSVNGYWLQLLLFIGASSASAASFPLVMSITTEIVEKEGVTTTMGIVQSLTSLTRVIMSPVMGYVADVAGLTLSMSLCLIPPTLAGMVVFAIRETSARVEASRAVTL